MRVVTVAAAQMGPIQKAEGRQQVVARMIALMEDAINAGANFIDTSNDYGRGEGNSGHGPPNL